VLDRATSELVERSTYQAYGAAESDYRPERWDGVREDYRFTGKEEDVEVGLQYFGKRYYAPQLGRWVSADPLSVHRLGADANLYAYVNGEALRNVDPLGLQGATPDVKVVTTNTSASGDVTTVTTTKPGRADAPPAAASPNSSYTAETPLGHGLAAIQQGKDGETADAAQSLKRGVSQIPMVGPSFVVQTLASPVTRPLAGVKAIETTVSRWKKEGWRAAVSEYVNQLGDHSPIAPSVKAALRANSAAATAATPTQRAAARGDTVGHSLNAAAELAALLYSARSIRGCKCFAAGTLIATEGGERPIENVVVGDRVLSRDDVTGEISLQRVVRLNPPHDAPIVELAVGDSTGAVETIRTTAEHPFWVTGRGWTEAQELATGDVLFAAGRESLHVEGARSAATVAPVFNFEVEGTHSYFVSRARIWVHNACCDGAKPARPGPKPTEYRARFNEILKAQGKAELPSEWDAHHRIPQEYRNHPEFKGFEFDAPENIRGVSSARNGINVHQQITQEWSGFRARNPGASRAEIEKFAGAIDAKFGYTYW
jgi:RHS repeat-associated protein